MIAETILEQLGGKEFILMTGSKNFVKHEVPDEAPWLRMDLIPNDADVNRLKITYNIGSDLNSMHFYKFTFKDDCTISNEKKFENVYFDQLEEIFTSTTGLDTRIPRIKFCSNKEIPSLKKDPDPGEKKFPPSTHLRSRQNKKKKP